MDKIIEKSNINIKETQEFLNNAQNNKINLFGENFRLKNSKLLSKQKGKNNIIFLVKFGQEIFNLKYLKTGVILYSPNGEYKKQNFIKIKNNEIIIDAKKSKNPELEDFTKEIKSKGTLTIKDENGKKIHLKTERQRLSEMTSEQLINNKDLARNSFIEQLSKPIEEINRSVIKDLERGASLEMQLEFIKVYLDDEEVIEMYGDKLNKCIDFIESEIQKRKEKIENNEGLQELIEYAKIENENNSSQNDIINLEIEKYEKYGKKSDKKSFLTVLKKYGGENYLKYLKVLKEGNTKTNQYYSNFIEGAIGNDGTLPMKEIHTRFNGEFDDFLLIKMQELNKQNKLSEDNKIFLGELLKDKKK